MRLAPALALLACSIGATPTRGPVLPVDAARCPAAYPIKASVGERTRECAYHVPGGPHYDSTRPDLCFASEAEARLLDCWRVEEVL